PVLACIDCGRLMGVGAGPLTKLDHAINAALLLLHVALRTGDRAGLVAFADGVTTTVEPRRGASQLRVLLDAVGPLQPGEIESDYTAALTEVRARARRRALIAIFTDIVDRDQAAALIEQCALLRRRHLPLVITVRDPAVEDIARQRPRDAAGVYARAIAAGIAADRADALRLLRAGRVDVIDADARTLSPRLVNRYLELKRRAAL
ncbi:MAG TPA: VWA domain-containing protein, partial [Candidatus Dormibacteraeota bacterium]|nr:VWA domain-containing protein [Candidatus Dormibacteraeota bacterium]